MKEKNRNEMFQVLKIKQKRQNDNLKNVYNFIQKIFFFQNKFDIFKSIKYLRKLVLENSSY